MAAPKSWNKVKIHKVDLLPRFIDKTQTRAATCVLKALILGGSEASVLTPIATGTLINSRYNKVESQGTKVVGTTGYTADYALAVHDPDNAQKFRRPSAEKSFLTKGFENAEPMIRAVIKGAIKT
jgi:hypothetical protein